MARGFRFAGFLGLSLIVCVAHAEAASLSGGGTIGAAASKSAVVRPAAGKTAKGPTRKSGGTAKKGRPQTVVLYHVNHHETLRLQGDARGRLPGGIQRNVDRFLRCHYTNRRHAMNPRLTRLIYEIGRRYAGRKIEVVSGYRDPKFAKNPHSPHMKGLACDMRVEGVKNTELRDYFRKAFSNVGVGYYPNSSFVHLDVRKGASAFWIDYSGPKERALYSDSPVEDLRSGRAETFQPTNIDPSWADDETPVDEGGEVAAGVPAEIPAPLP